MDEGLDHGNCGRAVTDTRGVRDHEGQGTNMLVPISSLGLDGGHTPEQRSIAHPIQYYGDPGNLVTIPLLLAAAPASTTSSSMQIGHCAAAASSPLEAIEFTSQAQLSVDDAFREICRRQVVPLAFLGPVAALACEL
nr:uncharacterized protein LOC109767766 [Aegilops tauschii subsp. strangulata]